LIMELSFNEIGRLIDVSTDRNVMIRKGLFFVEVAVAYMY
jgi:hypothetical protein